MKLYGVLILLVTLSAVCGLKCYFCTTTNPNDCKGTMNCVAPLDRCSSTVTNGLTIKTCHMSSLCGGPIKCCEGDLCNSATPTGFSLLLLLVSSAIIQALL